MSYQQAGAPHVLLVDDSADEIYPLLEALRSHPCRVTVAFDGIQGYVDAVSLTPDVILMDMCLPRRDGITTIRMLKANPATEHIPVLFLTAATALDERLEGLRSGAVDYILKPFMPEEVVERVRIQLSLARDRSVPIAASTHMAALTTTETPMPPVAPGFPKKGQGKRNSDQVLQRAAAHIIQERLADPPRVRDLAAMLAVSERRITAAFKSSVGMSVFEFIRRERMCKAARLLSQTDLSMLDIVAEVGYSSAANFSTAFRQYWGRTPSAFRNNGVDIV
ncbi:MAG: helix-turn-helix domain-containing protein [Pusillimonas sp.]